MKRLLLIVLPLLLIVGCSKEPINYEETLNERDGVFYTKDTNKPYSGPVFSLYEHGKKKEEGSIKDGKMISRTKWEWNENGQKKSEVIYKDGKKDGLETWWDRNGQKDREWTFKDGKGNGKWTSWYENGQKRDEVTFKDNEMISEKEWNEDGSVKE